MTASLETFAKVRALHDRTTSPGEKASAAARMKTLARKAGMTVAQASAQLDAPQPIPRNPFEELFNSPEYRAARAERQRRDAEKRAEALAEYGSAEAVFADAPIEAALRAACEPLLGPGETWSGLYRLLGWDWYSGDKLMPDALRGAVTAAWPMPETVAEAWREYEARERLLGFRYAFDGDYSPHLFVHARRAVIEDALMSLPARSLGDIRARLSWLEFWPSIDVDQNRESLTATLATLRADVERMGQRLREQGEGAAIREAVG